MDSHVVEVDHPLVRHKLGLLRDVTTTDAACSVSSSTS